MNKKIKTIVAYLFLIFSFCFGPQLQAQNELQQDLSDSARAKTQAILDFLSGNGCTPEIEAEIQARMLFNRVAHMADYLSSDDHGLKSAHEYWQKENDLSSLPLYVRDFLLVISNRNSSLTTSGRFLGYVHSDQYVDDLIGVMYFEVASKYVPDDMFGYLINKGYFTLMGFGDSTVWKDRNGLRKLIFENEQTRVREDLKEAFIDFPKAYKNLKVMNERHNNPNIDFNHIYDKHWQFGTRAYFIHEINTMYIGIEYGRDWNKYLGDYIGELSHAEQFSRYPKHINIERQQAETQYLDSLAKLQDFYSQTNDSFETMQKETKYVLKTYDQTFYNKTELINGYPTIEWEAHKKIEPDLWEELKSLSPIDEK